MGRKESADRAANARTTVVVSLIGIYHRRRYRSEAIAGTITAVCRQHISSPVVPFIFAIKAAGLSSDLDRTQRRVTPVTRHLGRVFSRVGANNVNERTRGEKIYAALAAILHATRQINFARASRFHFARRERPLPRPVLRIHFRNKIINFEKQKFTDIIPSIKHLSCSSPFAIKTTRRD